MSKKKFAFSGEDKRKDMDSRFKLSEALDEMAKSKKSEGTRLSKN